MTSISFKDYAELTSVQRYELHKQPVTVDCSGVPRRPRDNGAGGIPAAIGPHIVRRSFRDHDLAALFEWAADQLVIATPGAIVSLLKAEQYVKAEVPDALLSTYTRWRGLLDRISPVRQWHDALEPGEMVFLPPEPWREVRS